MGCMQPEAAGLKLQRGLLDPDSRTNLSEIKIIL